MPQYLIAPLLLLVGAAIVSFVLTGLAILVARRLNVLAHPVERSSHTVPTPQVGGVGICLTLLTFLFLCPLIPWSDWLKTSWTTSISTGLPDELITVLEMMIGFGLTLGLLDDILHLTALKKLVGLVALSAMPFCYGFLASRYLWPMEHVAFPLRIAVGFAWVLFFTNAFNFMDGVNGQAGVFALNAILWWGLFAFTGTGASVLDLGEFWDLDFRPFHFAMAGAVLGFLLWNFPSAKTFMGDSGSLTIGSILAFRAVREGSMNFHDWIGYLLPLSVFIYDVIYTLIRRALRLENLLEAHRSHLYQRLLMATGWSHARLLAFHLPFYLFSGLAGLIYSRSSWEPLFGAIPNSIGPSCDPTQFVCLLGIAVLLLIYTVLVFRFEKRKAKETAS